MGLFRKKQQVHFERDDKGRVVSTHRSGDIERPSQQLLAQGKAEKRQRRLEKRERQREARRQYQIEYEKARHQAIITRKRREGRRAGSVAPIDRLAGLGGMSSYSTRGNYNPFGSMFDTGMPYRKPYKSGTKRKPKQYAVVGGKAYPVATPSTPRKKKPKRKKTSGMDMFDNYGFFK